MQIIYEGLSLITVEKYGTCEPILPQYKFIVNTTFKTEGDIQYVDADIDFKIPLSDELEVFNTFCLLSVYFSLVNILLGYNAYRYF